VDLLVSVSRKTFAQNPSLTHPSADEVENESNRGAALERQLTATGGRRMVAKRLDQGGGEVVQSGFEGRVTGQIRALNSKREHMKRQLVALLVLGSFASSAWAFQAGAIAGSRDGAGVPVAFQASLGVLNGEAKEHVYDYEGPGGGRRQLSRLDWDLKGIAMGGVNGSVRLMDALTINGGVWLALSKGSGEMEDYDWLIVDSADWTHYSLSDVDIESGYIFDLNVAWDFQLTQDLVARAMVGYKQNGWEWKDRGQYLLYPEYGYVPQDLGGENMINYEQEFRMPYLGASADWKTGNFTLSGYLTWSPIVAADDWDVHVARDVHYHETFDGGNMLGLGLSARYDFTQGSLQGVFLTAALDYQKISRIVGDMELTDGSTGESGGEEDVAGIENSYVIFSVGGGIRF